MVKPRYQPDHVLRDIYLFVKGLDWLSFHNFIYFTRTDSQTKLYIIFLN